MGKVKSTVGFSRKSEREFEQTENALKKVSAQIIADTKAKNSYLVIADEKGVIQKIAAKDL